MITKAIIKQVEGGFELHFSERYPYKEKEAHWVDFKTTREQARQIAQEAHSFHISNIVADLVTELKALNSPITEPLKEALDQMQNRWAQSGFLPNHKQMCHQVSGLWHYMSLICTDQARLIVFELRDTMIYEMEKNEKQWVLEEA